MGSGNTARRGELEAAAAAAAVAAVPAVSGRAARRRQTEEHAADGGPATRFTRSVAVVIGIDTYGEGIAPLRSAVADARAIAAALARDHGFETWLLCEDEARLPQLLALLRERLPRELGPDDRLLFYFAGHGVALDPTGLRPAPQAEPVGSPPHDSPRLIECKAGPAGYLLPAGARRADPAGFLPMQVLHDELARLTVRHALVILDCCFSGRFRWSTRDRASRSHFVRSPLRRGGSVNM